MLKQAIITNLMSYLKGKKLNFIKKKLKLLLGNRYDNCEDKLKEYLK